MPATDIVVREHIESRTYSYEAGKVTASRTFKVFDTTLSGLKTPADVRAVFGSAGDGVGFAGGETWLPEVDELFPGETELYAQSYSLARDAGTEVWTVVWTYRNAESGSSQPNEPGYVEYTLDVSAGFVDTYFVNPQYPRDGTLSANDGSNQITGGAQIDIEGTPISSLRLTTDINISETVASTGGMPAVYTQARAARGKRNSATWEGLAKGRVVYLGCTVRRIGVSLYSVQHRLQEASDFHLIQYPERDSTGRIPTSPINGKDRASKVLWRQPFPDFYDFTLISSNW
jgi:hypothetical protein